MATPTYNTDVRPQDTSAFTSSLDTNDATKQLIANYIQQLSSAQSGGAGVAVAQFGSGSDPQSLGAAQVGIISAGSNISIDGASSAAFVVEAGSTVNFDSPDADRSTVSFDIIVGSGSNSINLNAGSSLVQGTSGNDTFQSGGGMDTLVAGSGVDSINGGGRSFIQGGSGSDTLTGGNTSSAQDTIYGGSGPAVISVSHGQNVIYGGTGPETITAGSGNDTIYAGPGAETINGGIRTDIIGGGNSLIQAGSLDTITAFGSDTVIGGSGSSTISTSQNSHASIQGGSGAVTVNLANSGGANDTIFGGSGGLTINVLQGFAQVQSDNTKDASGNTIIQFTNGQTLHVNNVTVQFSGSDHKTQSF